MLSMIDLIAIGVETLRILTERIDVVVNCTPIRVKIKAKLINFRKLIRIEGYNGK